VNTLSGEEGPDAIGIHGPRSPDDEEGPDAIGIRAF
jgi:hypothetical protein